MAQLLRFKNSIDLQEFLIDLQNPSIRTKGKSVLIDKEHITDDIDKLLEKFAELEQKGSGKA